MNSLFRCLVKDAISLGRYFEKIITECVDIVVDLRILPEPYTDRILDTIGSSLSLVDECARGCSCKE